MRIPVIDAPDVATQAIGTPPATVDPSPLAQNVGRGLQEAGGAVQQFSGAVAGLARQAKDQADAAQLSDAKAKAQDAANQQLWDPKTGLMFKRGDQVFPDGDNTQEDLGQKTIGDLSKRVDEISTGLSNDTQRREFRTWAGEFLVSNHRQIEAHVGQQIQVAKQASLEGLQATSLQALANSYADPVARAQLLKQPEESIAKLALSPEDHAAKLAEWRQKANSTVLNQFIGARDYAGAQAYFSQVKDQLGTAAPQFEHTITTLKAQVVGDQTAVGILNQARKPNGFIDDAQAVSAIEALPPGPDKQAAEESFHKYFMLEKQKELNVKSNTYQAALTAYLGNHSLSDVPAEVKSWLVTNDPDKWKALEIDAFSWAHREQRKESSDPNKAAQYIDLLNQMAEDPVRFRNMDVAEFNRAVYDKVTEHQWVDLGKKLAELKARPVKDLKLAGAAEAAVTGLFKQAFQEKTGNPKQWSPEHLELWGDVHDYVVTQAGAWAGAHHGQQPDLEQYEKWAKERLAKGSVVGAGTIFGDKNGVTRVEAEHKYTGKQFLEDIPDAVRASIKTSFKKRGVKPTDEQIRSAFEQYKAGQTTADQ